MHYLPASDGKAIPENREYRTVRVANSAIGTNTDLKGMYTLSVAEKDTIEMVYSCIGFNALHSPLLRTNRHVMRIRNSPRIPL